MYGERRTTRSSRRQLDLHENIITGKRGKHVCLTDAVILTPPPSQSGPVTFEPRTTRRWRGKRQYEDPLDQPPPTPSYPSRKKTRYGDEVAHHSSSLSSDPSCSSSTQDPSMSSFHNEDLTLEFGFDFELGVTGLASDNDPYLGDGDNVDGINSSSDLHTPPMSPADMQSSLMPATPNPRPETPGNSSPLTPSLVAEIGSSTTLDHGDLDHDDLDHDDDHDTTSLVGMSTLSQFGPPPTPMCPPRVGNLSSSSTSSLLQLSSAIRTTTPTSAAPPINILASDDDDDNNDNNDEAVIVQNIQNINNHNNKEFPTSHSQQHETSKNNNLTTVNNPTKDEEDNLYLNTSKNSPDIVSDSHSFNRISSPPSPQVSSSMSKHSQRLRIRAPPLPSARSGKDRKSEKSKKSRSKDRPHTIKSILKTNSSKHNKRSKGSASKATVNFSKETVNNEPGNSGPTANKKSNNHNNKNNKKGLMLPPKPKPKPATQVPSSPLSKQDGALPLSVRTASYPPEISKKKRRYIRDGNIVNLKLINFMAHQNRAWTFDQGVTFINGKNGSGKSAIQLGMKFLVGEKAMNTLRTSSIKHLIKNGQMFAEIEGHFTNFNGSVSKKRYGEMIKLRRRIKYTGGSNYTICGADGRWRQIKQHELGYITHSLNIDPNNPFQFLQQDRFKESSKPGSSQQSNRDFIKFKAATQLTAIEDMLQTSRENVKVAMKVVSEQEEMRRIFSLQEKQLKEQLEMILNIERSQNRLVDLENELAWAEVKVREEELKEKQEEKAKLYPLLNVLEEERKKLEDDIANFNSKEDKNKKLLQDVKQRIKKLETEKEKMMQLLREVKRTQQRAQSQHSAIISKIRQYTEEIDDLERKLNKETISYEAENQKYQAEIEQYEQIIEEKKSNLEVLRNERDKVFEEIAKFKATKLKEEQMIKQLQSQQNETNRELKKRDNFGWHMNQLQIKIDKYKYWKHKPVGPLGQGISVSVPKYAPLIEHIVYGDLFTFVVQTKEDYAKMREFIAEVYNDNEKTKRDKGKMRNPTLSFMPETNVDEFFQKVSDVNEKMKSFRTVYSMLSFKNKMVELGMIEKTRCERVVLFDSNMDAVAVMKDSTKFPPELKVGYTMEWFRTTPYPHLQFQPLPGMKAKTDILPMAKGGTTNQIDEEIARKKETIKTCRYNLEGARGLEQQLRNYDGQINDVNKQINILKNKIKHAQSCIREEPAQNQDKEVADQIKMVQEMLRDREKEIKVPLSELELAKGEAVGINDEIKKIDAQFPELRRKLGELEGDHNGANRTVVKLAKELENCKARRKGLDKERLALSEAENKIYFDMEKIQKKASQLGDRPKEVGDPEAIQRELEITKELFSKNKHKLKFKRKVEAEHKNRQSLVLQITEEINLIKDLCNKFKPLIKVNTDYYEKLKKKMSSELISNFRTLVEAHRLTGDLLIDWENKTIGYMVCPDKSAENKVKQFYSQKDGETIVTDKPGFYNYVQGLSGGERSKALVFFIMAMWKITDMPFHVLDEFEACLDDQSRIDIHEKIIQHARKHSESQFFILTPLELIGLPLKDEDLVKVIHMKKRN